MLQLPPPHCCAPSGSFDGVSRPPEAGGRGCRVCGMPIDRETDSAAARETVGAARAANATAAERVSMPDQFERKQLSGRFAKR